MAAATAWYLAPSPLWNAFAQTGVGAPVASFATLYTYQAGTTIPRATFADPSGLIVNPNPITLDATGSAQIYWANDSLYRIQLYDSNGFLVFDQDNYPVTNSSGNNPITVFQDAANLIRNSQFTFWGNTNADFTNLGINSLTATDWYFRRNNTNATVTVSQAPFTLGQSDVPANPLYGLQYQCTAVGAGGEIYKQFSQDFKSVQTLSGRTIVFGIWALSPTTSPLIVQAEQFFGTGGSPSASVQTTLINVEALTNTFTQYQVSAPVTLPSVSGKTLGTNGDDVFRINILLPQNVIANITMANLQLQIGNTLSSYPYLIQEYEYLRTSQLGQQSVFYTGDFKHTLRTVADPGWVLANDTTIGGYNSGATGRANDDTKALFNLIWNVVSNTWAPIYNSNGTVGTRGANADADFNANKRLALTLALGRVLAGYGTGVGLTTRFLGQVEGEQLHTMTEAELVSHQHGYEFVGPGGGGVLMGGLEFPNNFPSTNATGGSQPFNVIQPTTYVNIMIKL